MDVTETEPDAVGDVLMEKYQKARQQGEACECLDCFDRGSLLFQDVLLGFCSRRGDLNLA